jgi:hypothetical protein
MTGAVAALAAVGIFVMQDLKIKRGQIVVDPTYNGPAQVSATVHAILRYLLRRSVYVRKFIFQYLAHFAVRVMYYLDKCTTFLYAQARNWFVQNAVRNRGTVPHFWNHLKVYKQEMDKEKKETE